MAILPKVAGDRRGKRVAEREKTGSSQLGKWLMAKDGCDAASVNNYLYALVASDQFLEDRSHTTAPERCNGSGFLRQFSSHSGHLTSRHQQLLCPSFSPLLSHFLTPLPFPTDLVPWRNCCLTCLVSRRCPACLYTLTSHAMQSRQKRQR